VPAVDGAALLIAIERGERLVLRYLLGEDFIEIWGYSHLRMILDVIYRERLYDYVGDIMTSLVAKNIFISLPEGMKYDFVRSLHQQYSFSEDQLLTVRHAMSQKFYAPYMLTQLIERDQFKKINDFSPYERCIKEISTTELI
jgi:hypothetical protein